MNLPIGCQSLLSGIPGHGEILRAQNPGSDSGEGWQRWSFLQESFLIISPFSPLWHSSTYKSWGSVDKWALLGGGMQGWEWGAERKQGFH